MRLACYLMLPADPPTAHPGDAPGTPAQRAVAPATAERIKVEPCPAAADARRNPVRGPRAGRGPGQRRAAMRTRA